jgi:diguanylate cyclase (GGDEF)-like protein
MDAQPSRTPLAVAREVARRLAIADGAETVLDIVARAMHDVLEMTVCVNRLRPAHDDFEVTAQVGGGGAVEQLIGERYPVDEMLRLVNYGGEICDGVHFIAHDAPVWESFEGAVVMEQVHVRDHPDAWYPGDSLFVPLRDPAGEVLAILVTDDPADGLRPGSERVELVAIIAQLAGSALAARFSAAEAASSVREQQALSHLSASLAAGLDETEILERATAGVSTACGFRTVAIGLFDHGQDAFTIVAVAGDARDALLGARLEAGDVTGMLHPEHAIADSFLIPAATIHASGLPPLHSTRDNASGSRGWNHHLLAVPLGSGAGVPLGLLLGDDPADVLQPSIEKVRRIELFARQAALLVEGARSLAAAQALAARDELTGLENARAFAPALDAAIVAGRPLALALVDVDRFKRVNDALGHLRGDALLRTLGRALAGLPGDVDAYRIGGDEFAVLAPERTPGSLAGILDALRAPLAADGVSFSAGVAAAPGDASDGAGLRDAADRALYAAKRAGRGRTMRYGDGREPALPRVA